MTETDLRWQLRQLPREIEPGADLWPGILAGIERRPARRTGRWIASLAMAASLLLAGGLFWRDGARATRAPAEDSTAIVVNAETRALTDEYQAALQQFDGAPIPSQLRPALQEVDRSVVQIRHAIAADPDSVFLLQQLRKTYSLRLSLTQRAVTS
jgi:hypothetical protein